MPRTNSEAFLARLEAIIDARRDEPAPPALNPGHIFGEDKATFEAWLAGFQAELAPSDPFEVLYVAQVQMAVRRLRRAALAEPADESKIGDAAWCRYQALAQKDLDRALKDLRAHQQRRAEATAQAEARRDPNDFTGMSPWGEPARYRPGGGAWRDRIELDTEISLWPVIKGTTVEAEEINALLEDAWPVEYLLHCFPKICVADILACIDCDRAGKCGPFRFENKPEYFYQD